MAQSTSTEEIRSSVSSLYADLLNRRNAEREEREARKLQKEEEKRLAREAAGEDGESQKKLSKKEKVEAATKHWEQIVIGLTGDDLEYHEDKKSKKKKYKKWIADDEIGDLVPKKKKPKKKNYNKEFEHELNMLKNIVADQNRFTVDLQKRFQNAAGPATKDAMPLNKTLVELAAAVNASRSNSLGYLNAISGIKKTIAELYMKQKKLENDLAGGSGSSADRDLALVGSSIAAAMASDAGNPVPNQEFSNPFSAYPSSGSVDSNPNPTPATVNISSPQVQQNPTPQIPSFDPATWEGEGIDVDASVLTENVAKEIVVEKSRSTGNMRFKAIRKDDGSEIPGCPVPTSDLTRLKINEDTGTVRGEFSENYRLEYVD